MEEWVQAAGADVTVDELLDRITAGVDPLAAVPWWALSGLVARRLHDGADQPLWRAWATALLVQPDLRRALPDDVPRRVLDRLRMTSRERLRALWWHADQSGHWERLATLEQLGRSSDRRRRWSALDEASVWAPSWAWDVSRVLADGTRPGRNQEVARIAAWEAHHLISNGGELALIGLWLRAAGEPPPDPVPPPEDPSRAAAGPGRPPARDARPGRRPRPQRAPAPGGPRRRRGRRVGPAARAPRRASTSRAPDARRAVRAAVGRDAAEGPAVAPGLERAARRACRACRSPRWSASGEQRRRAAGEEGAHRAARPRRRRRRRLRTAPGRRGRRRGDAPRRPSAAPRTGATADDARAGRRGSRPGRAAAGAGAARSRAGSGAEGAGRPRPPEASGGVSVAGDDRSEVVADELWERVRTMAARAARARGGRRPLGELDEDGRGRLAALRMRCARAAERAPAWPTS